MKPLRVAMLIHGYHPRVGGAERVLAALCPELRALDIDVHVLTRRFPGLPPFEVINHVAVHRLPVPGPKLTASLSFTVNGLLTLRKVRPDIVHAHEMFSAATTAVAAKQWLGVPAVVTAHSSGTVVGDVRRLQARFLGPQRLRLFQRRVDAFVAVCRAIDSELADIGVPAPRRFCIPNGVDTHQFTPAPDPRAVRRRLGLPESGPMVVFTGRLIAAKRVDNLMRAWPAVRAAHPDAALCVVGAGPEEAALRAQAGAGILFMGSVDDVTPYLQAADVFALPSVAEGLSVAMLEAMACGLAVVVTRVGGAEDAIEHGRNGWLVPPDDVGAMQSALLELLEQPPLRARLGEAARRLMTEKYSLSVVAQRLRAVYDLVLAPTRR